MSDKTILFGIKNCDSVKKARKWLEHHNIAHEFHDFRGQGLSKDKLQQWLDTVGPETLINTRSTTWKQLNDNDKALAMSKTATAVILANPTLIKRPVLESGDTTTVGFNEDSYNQIFQLNL